MKKSSTLLHMKNSQTPNMWMPCSVNNVLEFSWSLRKHQEQRQALTGSGSHSGANGKNSGALRTLIKIQWACKTVLEDLDRLQMGGG